MGGYVPEVRHLGLSIWDLEILLRQRGLPVQHKILQLSAAFAPAALVRRTVATCNDSLYLLKNENRGISLLKEQQRAIFDFLYDSVVDSDPVDL